jgi:hypothetical protein
MLAPFTAGWQSTDLHPLVIERSEVLHSTTVQIILRQFRKKIVGCQFKFMIHLLCCRVLMLMISMERSI